jgi:hypothetical protein
MSALRTRVEAAERLLGQVTINAEPLVILGGLEADASSDIGFAASQHFERDENETVEAFRVRVMAVTRAARTTPIFGGLPPMVTAEGCE